MRILMRRARTCGLMRRWLSSSSSGAPLQKKTRLQTRIEKRHRDIEEFLASKVPSFEEHVGFQMRRRKATILQLNIGLHCNQSCTHCHVESSPERWEMMEIDTAKHILKLLEKSPEIDTVDLTGGAPELNKSFKTLVDGARALNRNVIDRCNLTVLFEPNQEYLPDYLAENKVQVVASLPCYSKKNVNQQRGKGVFGKSISALEVLNKKGYGMPGSDLKLDLVYNPVGASLPGPQEELEAAYKERLREDFGIEFNNLFTITNMPVKRFSDFLYRQGMLEQYMTTLVNAYNPSTVENVMCRDLINISWDGKIYDCDFNQQMGISVGAALERSNASGGFYSTRSAERLPSLSVFELDNFDELEGARIVTGPHCYGCTAGSGSSCQGTVA